MRDDNTEPRDNQQIADDNQQSEIDITQRTAETVANRALDEESDSADDEVAPDDRPGDED
jgi:hypothetical protein